MKKILFLIPLFLMVLLPHNVFALNFEKGEDIIEVDCSNFIYYAYQNYKNSFENYSYFVYYHNTINTKLCGLYFINTLPTEAMSNDNKTLTAKHSTHGTFQNIYYNTETKNIINNTSSSPNNSFTLYVDYILYSNFSTENYVIANITKEDIENYFGQPIYYTITYYLNNEVYKTLEIEKGSSHIIEEYNYNNNLYTFSGWSLETTDIDLNNITGNIVIRATLEEKIVNPVYINNFPITKEEYYISLILISILIIMQFLKWCFPFKGGSDLR